MRVFVTGATGFIGSTIVRELIAAGHKCRGSLARTGLPRHVPRQGRCASRLEDLESLSSEAATADGVIHTAFIHDFSKLTENAETDRHAAKALGSALVGSERPLIVTSGTGLLTPGRLAIEENLAASGSTPVPRVASEEATVALGVRVSGVHLPPSGHGDGDHGVAPLPIGIPREKGVSAYVGEGLNRWPAVHRLDAVSLPGRAREGGRRAITGSPTRSAVPRYAWRSRPPPERGGRKQGRRRGSRLFWLVCAFRRAR